MENKIIISNETELDNFNNHDGIFYRTKTQIVELLKDYVYENIATGSLSINILVPYKEDGDCIFELKTADFIKKEFTYEYCSTIS